MKRITLLSNLLLFSIIVNSQIPLTTKDKKSYNQLILSTSLIYNLNSLGIDNNSSIKTLSTTNDLGYNFGLDFQHKTKKRFTYGLGIGHCTTPQNLSFDIKDYSSYFENPTENDKLFINQQNGPLHDEFNHTLKTFYLKPHIGVLIPINRNWSFEGQYSYIITMTYSKGELVYGNLDITLDNGQTFNKMAIVTHSFNSIHMANTISYYNNAYVGLQKRLNSNFLKSLNFGFDFNYGFIGRGENALTSVRLLNENGELTNIDEYNFRNISVGFRLGLGIGK